MVKYAINVCEHGIIVNANEVFVDYSVHLCMHTIFL